MTIKPTAIIAAGLLAIALLVWLARPHVADPMRADLHEVAPDREVATLPHMPDVVPLATSKNIEPLIPDAEKPLADPSPELEQPPRDIEFLVIDREWKPVAGAEVELDRQKKPVVIADGDGRCRTRLRDWMTSVRARAPVAGSSGWRDYRSCLVQGADTTSTLCVIPVSPLAHLQGVVRDSEGRPSAGAVVTLEPWESGDSASTQDPDRRPDVPAPVRADANGAFALDLDPDGRWCVTARLDEAVAHCESIKLPSGSTKEVSLQFAGAFWLEGMVHAPWDDVMWRTVVTFKPDTDDSVLDPSGHLTYDESLWKRRFTTRIDDSGHFRIPLDHPMSGWVVVDRKAMEIERFHRQHALCEVDLEDGVTHRSLQLVIPEPASIAGHVRSAEGSLPPGSIVACPSGAMFEGAIPAGAPPGFWKWIHAGDIRDDGSFTVIDLTPDDTDPPETFDLYYLPSRVLLLPLPELQRGVSAGAKDIELVVPAGQPATGSISCSVIGEDGRILIHEARIEIRVKNPQGGWFDWRGTPMFSASAPDEPSCGDLPLDARCLVTVAVAGYATEQVYTQPSAGDGNTLRVTLKRAGSLAIDVIDADDEPAAWSRVSIEPVASRVESATSDLVWRWRGFADDGGHVVIPAMDRGQWRLTASRGTVSASINVSVDAGEDSHQTLHLPR